MNFQEFEDLMLKLVERETKIKISKSRKYSDSTIGISSTTLRSGSNHSALTSVIQSTSGTTHNFS